MHAWMRVCCLVGAFLSFSFSLSLSLTLLPFFHIFFQLINIPFCCFCFVCCASLFIKSPRRVILAAAARLSGPAVS